MEPEVRYCTTKDGVNIAYTVTGSGPPVILRIDMFASNVRLEWSQPLFARAYERVIDRYTLVRLDTRGCGMSDRTYPQNLNDAVLDIDAVVEALELDTFGLAATQSASAAIIAYAAQRPERVRRMAFVDGYLRNVDFYGTPKVRAIIVAAAQDYEVATDLIGVAVFGSAPPEAMAYGAYVRSCIDPAFFANAAETISNDATPLAAGLTMPVLVVRHDGLHFVTPEMTHALVSRFPNSRLVVLPGTWPDDPARLTDRLIEFFDDEESLDSTPLSKAARTPELSGLRAHELLGQEDGPSRANGLTPRELEVLRLIAAGRTNTEIAANLTLSVRTVGRHISNIYTKIGVRNRAEATDYAHRNRLT